MLPLSCKGFAGFISLKVIWRFFLFSSHFFRGSSCDKTGETRQLLRVSTLDFINFFY